MKNTLHSAKISYSLFNPCVKKWYSIKTVLVFPSNLDDSRSHNLNERGQTHVTTYYRNPEVKRTKASKLIKAIRIGGGEWSGAQQALVTCLISSWG